ncbi:NAD(P)-binding domain-containing protein [Olsenella sp. KGMB02461]|nr:NAD(P)-binding domain-containing protein [Olsenella sp. KGMB02461]
MKICVVGAGNVGILMAAEFASKGHRVTVVTSRPEQWSSVVEVQDASGDVLKVGEIASYTQDAAQGVRDAQYVFVTYPVYLFEQFCQAVAPVVHEGQRICFVPGADAEFYCQPLRAAGAVVCGLQRVHSVARIHEYGRSVYELGRKPSLQVAAIPSFKAPAVAKELEELFSMPAYPLPSFLDLTLTPSNPILHTSRIRTMFDGWQPGDTYPENFLFYEGWDDAASEKLLAADAEVQELCKSLSWVDLSGVRPLTEHYESPDVPSMTHKISHIPAFAGLRSPMREAAPGKWEPDFGSRYFSADFAYGLRAILDIAQAAQVDTPVLQDLWEWYVDVAHPARWLSSGVSSEADLKQLYC